MPGKISGVTSTPPTSGASRGTGSRANNVPNQASGETTASDSVQITDTASRLVTAEQALGDVPVVNPSRVATVSDALNAGTYKVSAERIANQLLQFERLLPDESPSH